ncbi:MAG: TIGR03619 family F420-dependent LLM class oxidoreductase [Acidimicrobiales bacterium]|jgi:probable F420-dependent oxidoreductase|nr:TIGR03619 family F420-dependent LLM class oxidoreductase [Acidimicrobiales bacterium]
MTPKLSMTLITFAAEDPGDWSHLVDRVQAADEAGLDRFALSDHVAFGENLEAYGDPKAGGTAGGTQPTGPDGHWLDPLATIAHLTAVTTRLRFSTNILIAALRRPTALAKTLSTMDVLSGGRVDLGIGVGWQREEYEACGLDFDDRGAQLDHTLEVLQTLWQNDRATYESDRLSFDGIHQMPKPHQSGGVPIWVSGTVNARSMRRLARFGSGWIPWGPDAADLTTGIAKMREAVAAEGRDPACIEVVANLPIATDGDGAADYEATMAGVPVLVEAGVTDFRAMLRLANDAPDAQEKIAEMVGHFRDATGRD